MRSLYQILGIAPITINAIDLGARAMGKVSEHNQFGNIPSECIGTVYGFEPDTPTCDEMNEKSADNYKYLPYAVFDGSEQTLHITANVLSSSLYEPDMAMRKPFADLYPRGEVVEKINMKTARLDDLSEITEPIHLIKADVQGAENVIFKNAPNLLKSVLVVQTEVFLLPLYKNMPLSGDVECTMNDMGFLHHRLWGSQGRAFHPLVNTKGPFEPLSQFTCQDVVYVKHWLNFAESGVPAEDLLKMALILHDAYKSIDLCHFVISRYDEMEGTQYATLYMNALLGK